MNHAKQEIFDALDKMRGHGPSQTFFNYLKEELELTRMENDYLDGLELTRSQGKAQALAQILKMVSDAPMILEKFAKQKT